MTILPEGPEHGPLVDTLVADAFGPDRFKKTAYRFRDEVPPLPDLCFVNMEGSVLRGSLRFWPLRYGQEGRQGLLLGPLAVDPAHRGRGFGKALMWHGLMRAARLGHGAVLLVGDPEYYEPFGFHRRFAEGLTLPGWVEERRFLGLELVPGTLLGVRGPVEPALPLPRKAA